MPEKRKKKSAAKKSNGSCSVESYKNKIVTFLTAYGKKLMPLSELEAKCRTKKQGRDNFISAFDELRTEGVITMKKGMKAGLCSRLGIVCGTVSRLSRTFGFAVSVERKRILQSPENICSEQGRKTVFSSSISLHVQANRRAK